MTERRPDEPELREVDADELAHDEIEPDPDQPPCPVPDDDEPDLGDFEGNLDA